MDDKEDTTLSQLATCQIRNNNDIVTGDLSKNDCDTKNSDESNEVNDKAEEHLSSVDGIVHSESIGKKSVQSSAHEEISTLNEGNIQDKGKDTDEDNEEELGVTEDDTKMMMMKFVRTILSCLMTATMG